MPIHFLSFAAKATSENLTSDNWMLILAVCDKVNTKTVANGARDCIAAIAKRLTHCNANVLLYALLLTEALVKNCGIEIHREVSSRAFTTTLVRLLNDRNIHDLVKKRVLELIQLWSFEFREHSSLNLMQETYSQLKAQSKISGDAQSHKRRLLKHYPDHPFPTPNLPKRPMQADSDKLKEEEELQLALALSLSENEYRIKTGVESKRPSEVTRVKALYDFKATERGELGFCKNDVIIVVDTKYREWWTGEINGRVGIFPANYVKSMPDLAPEASFYPEDEVQSEASTVDQLLQALESMDLQKNDPFDNEELQMLYSTVISLRPKIAKMIVDYGRKKGIGFYKPIVTTYLTHGAACNPDDLYQLSTRFSEAQNTYSILLEHSMTTHTGYMHRQCPPEPTNGLPWDQRAYTNGNIGALGNIPVPSGLAHRHAIPIPCGYETYNYQPSPSTEHDHHGYPHHGYYHPSQTMVHHSPDQNADSHPAKPFSELSM
ncbi:hypothetical protein K493DRAFT_300858 [Basidiobolus meristosporus CBS 931.73]|uniref:Class E vacuolar protein-sorting machinery protein HSE1 n=1 Tax=Basidiobolus meristosporus CBS 931.73 TaxID=1314790 RepID=A0A1Y1YEV8_9FUNG|nr:hypothetical protein K493DRAFT_300858 [Basidiobolus meristosporus CBS 931.73]|eukprot:ORX96580.1 hypothetical protein K493DRAFT_300858 [Basidiobolus meristosporus CBS 931.73]